MFCHMQVSWTPACLPESALYKPPVCFFFSSLLQVWLSCCWMSCSRRAMVWARESLSSLPPTSARQSSGRPSAPPPSTLAEVWGLGTRGCFDRMFPVIDWPSEFWSAKMSKNSSTYPNFSNSHETLSNHMYTMTGSWQYVKKRWTGGNGAYLWPALPQWSAALLLVQIWCMLRDFLQVEQVLSGSNLKP